MIYYLADKKISFRAKGVLASALHAFPEKKCTAAEFLEKHSHDHMNSEFLFKFVLDELMNPGYIKTNPEEPGVYCLNSYSD